MVFTVQAGDRQYELVVLVMRFPARRHDTAIRLARRHALAQHAHAQADGVVHAHGFEPADMVEAGRTHRRGIGQHVAHQNAHHGRARIPAARDKTAER